jgi:hypothetical protein
MLDNYASEIPNNIIYPIFKLLILQYNAHPDPLFKRASLKILGQVSDDEAFLDCIKDDVEELSVLIINGLVDQN